LIPSECGILARYGNNLSVHQQMNEWIKDMWYIYIYIYIYIYTMEYYSVFQKKELSFVRTWISLEHIILSEIARDKKINTA
jgi:hypothetical protein